MPVTTRFFDNLGLTRDSVALFWAKWCAFVIALAAMGTDISKVGIPESWAPYIAGIALFISVSSAQHRTSDLPGDSKGSVSASTTSRLPAVLLAIGLGAGGLLGLSTLPACHAPVTIVTEPGKIAYTADQIAVRVNELQNAAIQAEASGGMRTADTRLVVEFAVSANRTLRATPAGWQTTVATAWAETKKKLPAQTNPAIVAALGAVDVVLAAYGGVQ